MSSHTSYELIKNSNNGDYGKKLTNVCPTFNRTQETPNCSLKLHRKINEDCPKFAKITDFSVTLGTILDDVQF